MNDRVYTISRASGASPDAVVAAPANSTPKDVSSSAGTWLNQFAEAPLVAGFKMCPASWLLAFKEENTLASQSVYKVAVTHNAFKVVFNNNVALGSSGKLHNGGS